MAKAIDKNTRLVSMALVSNVNGFMHDAKAVSAIAHARGALVFADIIQAVGAVPVDVKALGIDFASSGTYKWLMGERGIGFLYVREDLQGTVLPTTRYGHRQVSNFNRAELTWEPMPGAARYETGGIPVILAAGVNAGIDYVNKLRHRQHPRARAAAHRSPAEGTAAARLQAADAARDRDADRRVRAEGRARRRPRCCKPGRWWARWSATRIGSAWRCRCSTPTTTSTAPWLCWAVARRRPCNSAARHDARPRDRSRSGFGEWTLTFP